ncbi:50S ribosomal protein L23 [Candidatus Saccharibacteria bacterium]|nr:50S ribosomal protein L23 [Candidatus Saccharibacteria bacterium]
MQLNMLQPRATEKTYTEQTKRVYVFPVDMKASKQAIAKRVEDEFNVKVTDVKTLIRKGKKTRYSRGKHAYPGITHRRDRKFAYVRLAEGNSIRVFDEQEDNKTSAKEAKLTKKVAKKVEKAAEKATKKAEKADKNAGKEKK